MFRGLTTDETGPQSWSVQEGSARDDPGLKISPDRQSRGYPRQGYSPTAYADGLCEIIFPVHSMPGRLQL